MRKIEKIEKYQRTSKDTLNKNREKGRMKSMLKNKSEQGITLVALVITVIIIIILATVAINFAFGDNGLITRAEQARDFYANDTKYTEESMSNVESYLEGMLPGGSGEGGDEPEEPDVPPTPTDPTEQEATEIATVTKGEEFTETTKVSDASGDILYVPKGFGIASDSPNEIDEGIVITNEENTKQFVWIPVDSTSLGEMYTVEETPLSTYTGVDATTSVYSKLRQGTSSTGGKPGSTSYREPDILISTDYGDASTTTDRGINLIKSAFGFEGTTEQILDQFADMLVAEYETTYASIEKYDGFYIGRYELTGSVGTPTVQKDQTVLTADIAGNWYQLYKACSNVVTEGAEYGAQSTMIYGNQWDEVLDWLVDTGMSSSDVYTNSASWGNYSDSTGAAATNKGSKQPSGTNEAWQANNIYDLAGNCYEWTQEAGDTNIRVSRGRLLQQLRFELSGFLPL